MAVVAAFFWYGLRPPAHRPEESAAEKFRKAADAFK
jgi:hypothetical protein